MAEKEKEVESMEKTSWNKLDERQEPTAEILSDYIGNPLWESLTGHIEEMYSAKPAYAYSGCSMQEGWNVKYKKAGRALTTLYPMEGYFIALVVIGERERVRAELALPGLSEYTRKLYRDTKPGMGQRWLMIEVTDEGILDDVRRLIEIRRTSKK